MRAFLSAALLLSAAAAAPAAFAQQNTFGDFSVPLIYNVENSGARLPPPVFPSFAQLPIIHTLPDPFAFADGARDESFASWERHRNEILAAVEKYQLGPKPDCHDCTITAAYTPPATGSTAGSLTVNVTRTVAGNPVTLTLTSGVFIPQGLGNGPFPVLIPMEIASFSFDGSIIPFPPPTPPDYASLPPAIFQNLPIATVGYVATQVAGYALTSPSDHTQDPFYLLYPELCEGTCNGTSNQGEYAAWSWGVSRLIDGMKIAARQADNPLPVDTRHLAVSGCSFAGKMALYAGALDERIALTIAQENGGGGAPAWRVSHDIEAQGTVEDIDDTNYDWYSQQLLQFAGDNVYKLPYDQHEVMALVAPRALLQTGNASQYWLSNGAAYVSSRATQQVYNTLGIGDRFGFFIDGNHAHCATNDIENAPLTAFVQKFMLGQKSVKTDVEVLPTADNAGSPIEVAGGAYAYDFPSMNYARWTKWWGSKDPYFPDSWNTGGTLIEALNGSLAIKSGDLVSAGYQLAMTGKSSATVSLVSGKVTTDVRCENGNSYTLVIPLPAQSYPITGSSGWVPGSAAALQGSVTAAPPAGVECVSGRATTAYFTATGLSEGGDGNPGGPGFLSTDVTDPLFFSFQLLDGKSLSPAAPRPLILNFNPLSSANSTNLNPVAQ